jgi:hypothetical protein
MQEIRIEDSALYKQAMRETQQAIDINRIALSKDLAAANGDYLKLGSLRAAVDSASADVLRKQKALAESEAALQKSRSALYSAQVAIDTRRDRARAMLRETVPRELDQFVITLEIESDTLRNRTLSPPDSRKGKFAPSTLLPKLERRLSAIARILADRENLACECVTRQQAIDKITELRNGLPEVA